MWQRHPVSEQLRQQARRCSYLAIVVVCAKLIAVRSLGVMAAPEVRMHMDVRYVTVDLRVRVPACMHAELAPARRSRFVRSAWPSAKGTSVSNVKDDCVRASLQRDVPDGPIPCGNSGKSILTTDLAHSGPNIAQTLARQLAHVELRLALLEAETRSQPDNCQEAVISVHSQERKEEDR